MSYMALGSSNHKVMLRVNYLAESNFQGKKKKKKGRTANGQRNSPKKGIA